MTDKRQAGPEQRLTTASDSTVRENAGYATPLYDAALPGWRRVEAGAVGDRGEARAVVLCLNPVFINRLNNGPQFEKVST